MIRASGKGQDFDMAKLERKVKGKVRKATKSDGEKGKKGASSGSATSAARKLLK